MDTERGHGMLNRLYFLYEAYDNYWDFPSLIDIYHRDVWRPEAVGRARSASDPRIEEAPRRISALQAERLRHETAPPFAPRRATGFGVVIS